MSFIAKNPLSLPEIDYTPSTPSGTRGLYPKEDGWYDVDDNGNVSGIGVFIVNVSVGRTATDVTADKTFSEIAAAFNSNKTVVAIINEYMSGDLYIPIVACNETDGMIMFGKSVGGIHYGLTLFSGNIWFYSKMEYAQTDLSNVDNATFKAKAESAGVGGSGGGNKDFIVNFTIIDENMKCTSDKTFEEVQAAIQDGYNLYGTIGITIDDVYGNIKIPLTISNEYGCWFTGIHATLSLAIYLLQNGDCSAQISFLADEGVYDTLLLKADKSTTLSGYGITDAYTKDETNNQIGSAISSGVTPALIKKAESDLSNVPNEYFLAKLNEVLPDGDEVSY